MNADLMPTELTPPTGRRRWSARAATTVAILGVGVLAGLGAGVGGADAATTPGFTVSKFTQSATTLNATTSDTLQSSAIKVSVHVVDPAAAKITSGSINAAFYESVTPVAGSYSESNASPSPVTVTLLTLSSGTQADGTWTGTLGGPDPGWGSRVVITDLVIDGYDTTGTYIKTAVDGAALVAAGATPVTASVSAAPNTPTKFSSANIPGYNAAQGFHLLGTISWSSVGPTPTAITVESFSGCGPKTPLTNGVGSLVIDNPPFGFCTVKIHLWNSAGRSASASYTAFFL